MNRRQKKKKERFKVIRLLEMATHKDMCAWVHCGNDFLLMEILSIERERYSCRAKSPEYVIVCRQCERHDCI